MNKPRYTIHGDNIQIHSTLILKPISYSPMLTYCNTKHQRFHPIILLQSHSNQRPPPHKRFQMCPYSPVQRTFEVVASSRWRSPLINEVDAENWVIDSEGMSKRERVPRGKVPSVQGTVSPVGKKKEKRSVNRIRETYSITTFGT